MNIIQSIQNRIYEVRGQRVMLDRDLAELYEVETKALNLAVKRNAARFPEDFMFQLSTGEWESLRFQIETSNAGDPRPQDEALKLVSAGGRGGTRYLPYAFTEQGVAMLSGILRSERAISMNIAIMRAFVELRRVLILQADLSIQLRELKERVGTHDSQLSTLYDAIENLLDEKASQRKWEDRDRIGFKQKDKP